MSKDRLALVWEQYVGGPTSIIEILGPFGSGGSASFPGHSFFMAPEHDVQRVLIRFTVEGPPKNVYVYDPYHVEGDEARTRSNLAGLTKSEYDQYMILRRTYLFSQHYVQKTGRAYLVNYPRPRPAHFMWRADYFDQVHWVTTRETQFVHLPPKDLLQEITHHGVSRRLKDSDPRLLAEYRESTPIRNMTLRVLSCAPRVFEVPNFLSQIEVDHILELAAKEDLALSSTGFGADAKEEEEDIRRTRTSYNSWLPREKSPILDAVYRRASDLMRIDEALLRFRTDGERPDVASKKPISESLQLVHYGVGQEYTAHHDFGFSDAGNSWQAQRFATLLLYLNEGMKGGATTFPRWANAETFEELRIEPQVGKAALFYSQLPDGNMDDLSHHQANKIREGEKWLINLWVWSPVYEH
eukprot:CAMPEP_0116852302 /NCGR_PEP_ID=MMETSP0418-20121206/17213_1 /TAXON_ID=1158023 /ORGANISM="Astrosyne radiata, Strain 13vi08-1A" /LENGTH=411 /DNA_ID=CAMNT_0004484441 /DNA_START=196 /DNA_END=1431 /DNA_ORIENTATION=+